MWFRNADAGFTNGKPFPGNQTYFENTFTDRLSKVTDVILEKGIICNNLIYTPDRGIYQDTPKTESSDRWIAVPPATVQLLKDWKAYQTREAAEKSEFYQNMDGLLFTQEDGSPMCPDSVTKWLNRFSKRHGLTHINPHKFRHTTASMLIYQHVDPVSVSNTII